MDIKTKKLGFGFMRLPLLDSKDETSVDIETVCKMVDLYLSRGFNYFDTAHRYHGETSEPALRKALIDRHPRESYILTNKITMNYIKSEDDQEPFIKNQLEICGVDYFDFYLIHNLNTFTYRDVQKYNTFDFMKKVKSDGLAKHIGFSYHDSPELLDEILTAHPEVELVQLQLNYLDWDDGGVQSRKCYEVARKHGKEVAVMEPIKGGNLVNVPDEVEKLLNSYHPDWSLAAWAIRFAASHDGIYTVLSGMSTLEQLDENTTFMENFVPLTKDELEVLKKAADMIKSATAIQCTACKYCEAECPQNIAISNYFALYNSFVRPSVNYVKTQGSYYNNLAQTRGKASDCINCMQCVENCPQKIEIPTWLEKVSETFE